MLREAAAAWLVRRFGLGEVPVSSVAACVGHQGARGVGAAPARACASRPRTPCCIPRCRTPPMPWARSWRAAGPSASRRPPGHRRRPRPRCDRRRRRGAGTRAVVELALEPDGRPRRPRRGGGVGPGARRPRVLRRVLRGVHLGRASRARCSNTAPTAWWPCTHSSKRSNLAGVRVGFYARRRRAGGVLARGAPARRPHGSRRRPRLPGSRRWPTTSTSTRSAARYRERLVVPRRRARGRTAARCRCPRAASTSGSRFPPAAGPTPGRWPSRWRRRRPPGQPGRPLRRRRVPATSGSRWSSRWSAWRWWGSVSLG